METIIKLSPSELTAELLDKIKSFVETTPKAEITLSIRDKSFPRKETREQYFERINRAIDAVEKSENLVSFTFDEFLKFSQNPSIQ